MSVVDASLSDENGSWVVTVVTASGNPQKYACTSEEQARSLVELFRTPPRPRVEKPEVKQGGSRLGWMSKLVKTG